MQKLYMLSSSSDTDPCVMSAHGGLHSQHAVTIEAVFLGGGRGGVAWGNCECRDGWEVACGCREGVACGGVVQGGVVFIFTCHI